MIESIHIFEALSTCFSLENGYWIVLFNCQYSKNNWEYLITLSRCVKAFHRTDNAFTRDSHAWC